MMRRLAITIIALTTTCGVLASCGGDDDTPTTQAPTTEAPMGGGSQVANPASEYCIAQGGELEIVDEANGQVGYCNLPDGTRIEEWEFFNQANG
jgi:putative hemolysin